MASSSPSNNKSWKRIFGIAPNRVDPNDKEQPSWKDSFVALRLVPRFIAMVWKTSPYLAVTNLLLRLCRAGMPVAQLYVGKLIIDEIVALKDQAVAADVSLIWQYVALEMLLVVGSGILSNFISLTESLLSDLFSNQSSEALITHAARLDLAQLETPAVHDQLERARQQTTGRAALLAQLFSVLQTVLTIFSLGAGILWLNPWLLLLLVVAVLPAFLSEMYFDRYSYSVSRSWTPERRELDYFRYIGASDETAKEIKIFGLSGFLAKHYRQLADQYYAVNSRLAIRRAFWGAFFNAISSLGYYSAYVFIIHQTIKGQLSLGDLTFLSGSFQRLNGDIQDILWRFSYTMRNALYLKDFFDFFALEPQITSPPNPLPVPDRLVQGFVFENVSFKYPHTDQWAVQNISFALKPTEKLALVGENGAGKTTITKLISRLYEPTEGRILLEGVDIRQYDLQQFRNSIGVIFQDFVRFQMTASNNIAIGQIDQIENRPLIETAAKQSLANTVIRTLPQHYDQMLGKRFANGVDLSGGQWQKIALARAYMRKASLLILDEPTAALDARAEHEVFQQFAQLTVDKAAILISHRFSTVRMADQILVLRNGKTVEYGSHAELLKQNGYYAELFYLQAEGYQ